jgi:hypothetical protein
VCVCECACVCVRACARACTNGRAQVCVLTEPRKYLQHHRPPTFLTVPPRPTNTRTHARTPAGVCACRAVQVSATDGTTYGAPSPFANSDASASITSPYIAHAHSALVNITSPYIVYARSAPVNITSPHIAHTHLTHSRANTGA